MRNRFFSRNLAFIMIINHLVKYMDLLRILNQEMVIYDENKYMIFIFQTVELF